MTKQAGIHPYRIDILQSDVDDLARRLESSRWQNQLLHVGWDYGVPSVFLRYLADHLRTGEDWRTYEGRLNELPQLIAEIDEQPVHVLRLRLPEPDALPTGYDRAGHLASLPVPDVLIDDIRPFCDRRVRCSL